MRFTTLLGKTLREPPSDAQLASHRLLVRGAYLRSVDPGLFAHLPLGQRVLSRLYSLLDDVLAPLDTQTLRLPTAGDRSAETMLVQLVAREVDSYRQLPLLLLHHTTLPEPEPRVRTGLFGADVRPAAMVHVFAGADSSPLPIAGAASRVEEALRRAFERCDLVPFWAGAGEEGRRAYLPHESSDEDLIHCPAYA